MSAEVDGVFLARDAYDIWKRRVRRASTTVSVFTPYFDPMLDRLLGNAVVKVDSISVVTDLSPESGALDYRRQLIGARALLRRGIELRSLPRLHAKVLLCDAKSITVGSQNFTSYARHSKETTSAPTEDAADSAFLTTLDEGYSAATAVSLEFVELLLAQLDQAVRELQAAERVLISAFEERWTAYLELLEQERLRLEAAARRRSTASQLATAVRRSAQLRIQSEVLAELQRVDGWFGDQTLKVSGSGDLTSWPARREGDESSIRLERLNMNPLILNPSGQMGFARVGHSQISYVRSNVRWNTAKNLIGAPYAMTVAFPDEGLDGANVHITLAIAGEVRSAELTLQLHVGGLDISLAGWQIDRGKPMDLYWEAEADRQAARLERLTAWVSTDEGLRAVVRAAFAHFKFTRLGIENRNAAAFFPSDLVRITAIEIADQPVLVVTPQHG
jgi:hypothetical protein